jgi:hypothetical protein
MADAAQCPFCELRFQGRWELKLHLDSDHPGRITEKERGGRTIVEDNDPDAPEPL